MFLVSLRNKAFLLLSTSILSSDQANTTLEGDNRDSRETPMKTYFPLLRTLEDVSIIAVMSRTAISARKLRQMADSSSFYKFGRRDKSQTRCMPGAQRHHISLQIVQELLKNDIDVYVEKPATTSAEKPKLWQIWPSKKTEFSWLVLIEGLQISTSELKTSSRPMRSAVHWKSTVATQAIHPLQSYLDDTIHIIDLLRF